MNALYLPILDIHPSRSTAASENKVFGFENPWIGLLCVHKIVNLCILSSPTKCHFGERLSNHSGYMQITRHLIKTSEIFKMCGTLATKMCSRIYINLWTNYIRAPSQRFLCIMLLLWLPTDLRSTNKIHFNENGCNSKFVQISAW